MRSTDSAGSDRVVAASSGSSLAEQVWRRLGVRAKPIDASAVAEANPQLHGGMIITEVDADSPAGKAGMQRGDILVGLHQFETLSLDNINWVLNHPDVDSFSPVKFFLVRNGAVRRGHLPQLR